MPEKRAAGLDSPPLVFHFLGLKFTKQRDSVENNEHLPHESNLTPLSSPTTSNLQNTCNSTQVDSESQHHRMIEQWSDLIWFAQK